jgi:hypothetical protein
MRQPRLAGLSCPRGDAHFSMPHITREKLDAIAGYLLDRTGSIGVEQYGDSERCVQIYRVWTEKGLHVLRVSDRFIAGHGAGEMRHCFDDWRVAERLVRETRRGILVTSDGLEPFEIG